MTDDDHLQQHRCVGKYGKLSILGYSSIASGLAGSVGYIAFLMLNPSRTSMGLMDYVAAAATLGFFSYAGIGIVMESSRMQRARNGEELNRDESLDDLL